MGAKRRRAGLVAARKAAGYTQESLAEALYVDRSTVMRWEAGVHSPVPYLWPKLGKLLGVSRERLVGFLAAGNPSPPANQEVVSEDMKRRTLMKWGVAATAVAGLSAGPGTNVGLGDVRRIRDAAARLARLDQQHGGDTLWQSALVQVHGGMHLLEHGTYTDTVARELLTATGLLQTQAGWMALDAGEHTVAHKCFSEALGLSRQVNDPMIETRALANLAWVSRLQGKPKEALRYAYGAEQAATGPGAPLWLAVIPQIQLADSSAVIGEARDTDRALSKARRVLDRDGDTTSEEWASFLNFSEIDTVQAGCAIVLGRPATAERLFEQIIAATDQRFARNLASRRVYLAQARLDTGAVDGAAEAADRVLDDLSGEIASQRISARLDLVATRLSAFPEVDEASRFLERYQAVAHS